MRPSASLDDKFDLTKRIQLLTGMQAIVRLVLNQKARDRAAGLNTAGYVTGYRGSPIATLESAFQRAGRRVADADIVFQPAINEDLAATAVWGSQQAELRGEGRFDGVFAVWYGKGPGVDRSGDAFRHANHAGTSKHGGVVALMGDDHTCESSTSAHQSEFAFVDAMIPILNPAGVQDLLDYGILGFALSRYAGVWVGLKCVKDNVESTAVVDAASDRVSVRLPTRADFAMPSGGLNIRLNDPPLAKEQRLHEWKRAAIHAFARANTLDRIVFSGGGEARIGIVTTGKSYADTRAALDMLGLDEQRCGDLGVRLYKVAMTWPLEPEGLRRFAEGLDLVVVVEEKRALIETQVKEQLYELERRPRVVGKKDEAGAWLLPATGALDPLTIAIAIAERIERAGDDDELSHRLEALREAGRRRQLAPEALVRRAYFCAGCPHNTSTRVPEGSRAYAGIGCHYMVQWMDRSTEGFTQMGGEGANWIGEAPFSRRPHIFQNIGDGTFVHSGSLAMRAAIASGVTMTYKLLFNDAVAMTGGQPLDGHMTVGQMVRQLEGEGARRIAVVSDEPEKYRGGDLPRSVTIHHRRELDAVQRELETVSGVSILVYDQTCAAEKRRRRKRGALPDPARRVAVNHLVCEGCGDCGVQSNCVAVLPRETELGRKRAIDQSACNKDYSCVDGLCPSFVTLEGAEPRRTPLQRLADPTAHLPEPRRGLLDAPLAILATGIGGTGVVTVTAILAQAAHLAGLGFGAIDVTGIAQKGGPVACHMRLARTPEQIHAIRVGVEAADVILGGDLVVTAANKVLETVRPGHTAIVLSTHAATTGDFTRDPDLAMPEDKLEAAIRERAGGRQPITLDAQEIALALLGDSIYANMLLVGVAYQKGLLPIASDAIDAAIRLNAVDVEANARAFRLGRAFAHDPDAVRRLMPAAASREAAPPQHTLRELVDHLARDLTGYQDKSLARRYRDRIERLAAAERRLTPGMTRLAETAARAYYKALAIKDEYEVARLFTDGRFARDIEQHFEGTRRVRFHMAPPLLARIDRATGRPRKIAFGPWLLPVLRLLAKGKQLRGSALDLFGRTAERRAERALIPAYEALLDEIEARLNPSNHAQAVALAGLPLEVRGFGVVKARAMADAERKRAALLAEFRQPATDGIPRVPEPTAAE
ncbi:MAG: indolepyruvate ferredoxin oxidoreductase family protein [Hyphomicrobiaceae bacterium]|nr:indolepyruvate ferredoxin oxidoreductase family protein [Hyphomicrobiaceae bacterium]